MTEIDELLTRPEAAGELRLTIKTMDNWRSAGRGPAFLKLGGRVLYPRSELEAFKRASRVATDTSRAAA
jgi:hypothetical protein